MNDFNETSNAINSNFEERTSSMSDYSTSTTPDETRYQENTPIITPEIVNAGSELKTPDVDDENNPIVLLSEKLPETEKHQLSDDECAFTREEAEALTQDLQLKYRDTIEAHYNLIAGVRKAHDGHIWLALGYPQGAAGWKAYCKDYFKASAVKLTREQRDNLILGLVEPNADGTGDISNTDIAILLGVDRRTVDRVKTKAGITQTGRVRGADGKLRHVDTGSMSSEERRKKIVELSEEGAKQTDIADMLDVSQSTVSETLRKDKMRRISEGLEPAVVDNTEFDQASDDQPLDLDMGNADAKIRSYIDAFGVTVTQANDGIEGIVRQLESDYWKPGSSVVDEIIGNNASMIFDIISNTGKMLRLLNIDLDNVFDGADDDDPDNDWSRFVDGCEELGKVCEEVVG
ncbi:helix-turn-helix domain-containing protein [Bifidobacterium pseudocatenulatum]|uniref:helix-turn-helix domain-containing protein n=1 Tax=Bifidobacterium pseudocatenulatum TaxID=28026 RepID=UPI0022E54386|nr:helix-turn-helix domain-containing protein [Bifidobacterium pseudocatenulatum]